MIGDRAIGICDSPTGALPPCRGGARPRSPDELWFDYFGLNHLGWLRGVYDGDRDLLPGLLADDERLESFEEGKPVRRRVAALARDDPERVPLLLLLRLRHGRRARRTGAPSRGEFLLGQQAGFYAGATASRRRRRSPPGASTRRERELTYFAEARAAAGPRGRRGSWEDVGGYEGQAIAVVEAIAGNEDRVLILDTANRSSLPFLDETAVVEVPCVVGRAGAIPTAVGDVPGARARADRDDQGRRADDDPRRARWARVTLAVRALALHPLVPSVNVARRIFERIRPSATKRSPGGSS